MKLEVITDNCAANTTGLDRSGNFGVINLGEFCVTVDSGHSPALGEIFRELVKTHFKVPVRYLILTHSHTDHRMGMRAYTDTNIVLSAKCHSNLPQKSKSKKYQFETFENELRIKSDQNYIDIYHVGGHTVGSSVVYFPHDKILFSGDLLFLGGANYNLPFLSFYQNNPRKTGNPEECIEALKKLLLMDIAILIPGHGKVVINVKETLHHQLNLYQTLKFHFLEEITNSKNYNEIELPDEFLIREAKLKVQNYSGNRKATEERWLFNYLEHLKRSFFNYYSSNQSQGFHQVE